MTLHSRRPPWRLPLTCLLSALLAACAVGPDYERPAVAVPETYRELAGWTPARPAQVLDDHAWWDAFGDPLLGQWMAELDISNQTLAQAEAQYRQAQALADGARSGLYPTATGDVAAARSGGGGDSGSGAGERSRYTASLGVSWVPDLWGRVRRQIESGQARVQASAADLAAVRLSAQAALARNYFAVRVLDRQRAALAQTEAAYQRSLTLTRNQYEVGLVSRADVLLAQTQLESVQVQLRGQDRQRAQLEHAVAVLLGRPPAELRIADDGQLPNLLSVPRAVPSELLERRPDIASAERRMAAANAAIGVARSAWFPNLTLSASGGFQAGEFAYWLSAPYRVWSLGPALAATLFDGGARRAGVDEAMAAYDAQVAAYRQTVLTGFQEVEDALVQLRVLEDEIGRQRNVVALAEENQRLMQNQYEAGIVSFLEVAVVQTVALNNRRTLLDLIGARLDAGVALIAALGGGWSMEAQKPTMPG